MRTARKFSCTGQWDGTVPGYHDDVKFNCKFVEECDATNVHDRGTLAVVDECLPPGTYCANAEGDAPCAALLEGGNDCNTVLPEHAGATVGELCEKACGCDTLPVASPQARPDRTITYKSRLEWPISKPGLSVSETTDSGFLCQNIDQGKCMLFNKEHPNGDYYTFYPTLAREPPWGTFNAWQCEDGNNHGFKLTVWPEGKKSQQYDYYEFQCPRGN